MEICMYENKLGAESDPVFSGDRADWRQQFALWG